MGFVVCEAKGSKRCQATSVHVWVPPHYQMPVHKIKMALTPYDVGRARIVDGLWLIEAKKAQRIAGLFLLRATVDDVLSRFLKCVAIASAKSAANLCDTLSITTSHQINSGKAWRP